MKYYFKDLPGMILVQTNANTRDEAQEKLDNYLNEQGIKAQKYYYLEMTRGGKVVGAMTFGVVESEPERNRKFPSMKFESEKYFVLELDYNHYLTYNDDKESRPLDINKYISDQGYQIKNLPMFEFAPELGENMIRVFIMVG